MSAVTVSSKGQVVIPAAIRHRLGIAPGTKLDFELEGDSIRVRLLRQIKPTRPEDGYGLLRCDQPGKRRLADFDVATAMRAELPNVNVEESSRIVAALDLLGHGLDFADALHLAGSGHCEALYTFDDRRFARRALRIGTSLSDELKERIVAKMLPPNNVSVPQLVRETGIPRDTLYG